MYGLVFVIIDYLYYGFDLVSCIISAVARKVSWAHSGDSLAHPKKILFYDKLGENGIAIGAIPMTLLKFNFLVHT